MYEKNNTNDEHNKGENITNYEPNKDTCNNKNDILHNNSAQQPHTVSSTNFYKSYNNLSCSFYFTSTKHFLFNFSILQIIKKIFHKHDPLFSNNLFVLLVNLSTHFQDTFYEYDSLILANFLVSKSNDKKMVYSFYHKFSLIFLKNHRFTNFLVCLQKMCLIDKKIKFDDGFIKRIARICIYKEHENVIQGDWRYSLDLILACKQRENEIKYEFDFGMYDLLESRLTNEFVMKIQEKKKIGMNENDVVNKLVDEICTNSVIDKNEVDNDEACVFVKQFDDSTKFISFLKMNNFKYVLQNNKICVCDFEEKSRIINLYEMKESMKRRQRKNIEKEMKKKREEEENEKKRMEEMKNKKMKEEEDAKNEEIKNESNKKNKKVKNIKITDYFRRKYNLYRIVMIKLKEYMKLNETFSDGNTQTPTLCSYDMYYNEREEIRKKVIKHKNEIEENKRREIERNVENVRNIKEELEKKMLNEEKNKVEKQVVSTYKAENDNNLSFRRAVNKCVEVQETNNYNSNTTYGGDYGSTRGSDYGSKRGSDNSYNRGSEYSYNRDSEYNTNRSNYTSSTYVPPHMDESNKQEYENKQDHETTQQSSGRKNFARGIMKVEMQSVDKAESYRYDRRSEENKNRYDRSEENKNRYDRSEENKNRYDRSEENKNRYDRSEENKNRYDRSEENKNRYDRSEENKKPDFAKGTKLHEIKRETSNDERNIRFDSQENNSTKNTGYGEERNRTYNNDKKEDSYAVKPNKKRGGGFLNKKI
ncbi:hypothetical protein BDAP_000029 [Binucleata daphniae]